jgi:hypothetical protein
MISLLAEKLAKDNARDPLEQQKVTTAYFENSLNSPTLSDAKALEMLTGSLADFRHPFDKRFEDGDFVIQRG